MAMLPYRPAVRGGLAEFGNLCPPMQYPALLKGGPQT
jgi:hypothetical protein